ncbi:hypothetical protein B0H14DRAFT_2650823 [Mycena olivaceomarginata]|nr:hypothetical protein B0H14DRAFT_2650823 [Mycena olivaceomarginata]
MQASHDGNGGWRRKPMAEYIAATQSIAVRFPAVSCSGDQEKYEGEWEEENKTQGKNSVRNRWDRRQHRAADLPIYPMFAAPTPRFASSITPTYSPASRDLTKTEPLVTWHSPKCRHTRRIAMAPALSIVRLALSVDLSRRIMSTLCVRDHRSIIAHHCHQGISRQQTGDANTKRKTAAMPVHFSPRKVDEAKEKERKKDQGGRTVMLGHYEHFVLDDSSGRLETQTLN